MEEKIAKEIPTIRKALVSKYEFPYYALIKVHSRYYGAFHIPAPWFDGPANNPRSHWAGNLPIAVDKRDGEYYQCPSCGEPSFFSGFCQDCREEFKVWVEGSDGDDGSWEDGPLPVEYENHEALKKAAKKELLYRLDHKIPDLGIISAEIVLSVPWGTERSSSPFLKREDYFALYTLDRVERKVEIYEELKKHEDYQKMIREVVSENGISIDEDEVIEIEGSKELRRQTNGIWQHKHDGHDYWHPMSRVHKDVKGMERDNKEEKKEKQKETFRLEDVPNNNHGCLGFGIDVEVDPDNPRKAIIVAVHQCTANCHGIPSSNWRKEGDVIELPEEFSSWKEASEWEDDESSFSSAGHTKLRP